MSKPSAQRNTVRLAAHLKGKKLWFRRMLKLLPQKPGNLSRNSGSSFSCESGISEGKMLSCKRETFCPGFCFNGGDRLLQLRRERGEARLHRLTERCIMNDISFICWNHMKAYLVLHEHIHSQFLNWDWGREEKRGLTKCFTWSYMCAPGNTAAEWLLNSFYMKS